MFATTARPLMQGRGGPPAPAPPASPQQAARIDLTGYWVSIVNEDWRWRMVTAPVGDFPGVPLNAAGQKIAKAWNPSTDGSCLAFGAPALLRMPTRVHITWENDHVLKIETDNGLQTRRLAFDLSDVDTDPRSPRSLQGRSVAEWVTPARGGFGFVGPAFGPVPPGGSLKVVTSGLSGMVAPQRSAA
jgi:hypothetical protein